MAIKLIMTDIDGTVLPYGVKAMPQPIIDAFHAAVDAGIHIGPATGRFYNLAPKLFNGDEKCCRTVVAGNGMQVLCDGELLMQKEHETPKIQRLVDVLGEVEHAGFLFTTDEGLFVMNGTLEDLGVSFPSYAETAKVVDALPESGILKANVFLNGSMEETRALADKLAAEVPELDFDVPQIAYLNVMPSGWGKGPALKWLMEHLGIAASEAVMFGDGGNDISMFDVVEHSVAVSNAMPEVLAAARWHIGDVKDFAVADAVNALAAGEWPFEN